MGQRGTIGALVVLLNLCASWLWLKWPPREPHPPNTAAGRVPTPLRPAMPAVPAPAPKIVQPFARTPYLDMADPRWVDYDRKRKTDRGWEWEMPIEFFGKVVDENSLPVSEPNVELEWVGSPERYGGDGVMHRKLTGGADGYFSVSGIKGKCMGVRVNKEGCHTSQKLNSNSFEYAAFFDPTFIEPDKDKPVVFHLVRKRRAEPTYHLHGGLELDEPALEINLDLLNKPVKRPGPADLFLRVTRPPDAKEKLDFAWTLEIEGRNGSELVETNDEFMTLAPDSGYKPRLVREAPNTQEGRVLKSRFYVKNTARRFFAAVEFETEACRLYMDAHPATLRLTITVNPNNSPELEYDPELDIREVARRR